MGNEHLQPRGERTHEREGSENREFSLHVQALDRSLGTDIPLPEEPSDEELLSLMQETKERGTITGFTELMRANEIVYKRKAIQHLADLESEQLRNQPFLSEEYVVASQLGTYFEGVEESVRYMSDSLKNYEAITDFIAALPAEAQTKISEERTMATIYISGLTRALDERTAYANARKLQSDIARDPQNQELKTTYEAMLTSPVLSPESKTALQGTPRDAVLHTAELDKKILRILEGTEPMEGVRKDFLPQHMYISALQARYTQLLEEQKRLTLEKAHQREGGVEAIELLGKEREGLMAEMISYTNELGRYQLRLSHLFATQNLFSEVDVDGAWMSPEGRTPAVSREQVEAAMQSEKEFHLNAVDSMVSTAGTEFTPGVFETLRDGIVLSTITSTDLALRLMNVFKIADFGTGVISEQVKDFLAGPIVEVMDWPRDPETGELKLLRDFTREEREKLLSKVGQLRDVMTVFQQESGSKDILETTKAIRALDATEGVAAFNVGNVQEPLPDEPALLTAADIPNKLAAYEQQYGNKEDAVATLQAVLFRQLHNQWGEYDGEKGGTGFIGAYARMLSEVERIIGVQLDLAGAVFTVSQRYFNLAKYATLTAGVLSIGTFLLSANAAYKTSRFAFRAATAPVRIPYRIARRMLMGNTPATQVALQEGPRATGLQRAMWGTAVAYEAYNLYSNTEELQRQYERVSEVKGEIEGQLLSAGFTKVDGTDTYEHPLGAKVSLKEIFENVDEQRSIQWARTGVAATEFGATLLMGPQLFAGPAGLAFIAVAVTVDAGITSYQNQAARDFLADPNTPPWLIAALGTEKLVERSEYDMLVNSSSWNFLFTSTEETKEAVRDKMYFTLFNQELGAFSPELFREMYSGRMNVGEIDRFFEEDFQSIVMPYAMVRLFALAKAKGSAATWEQISSGKVDRGTVIFPPDLTHMEIRQAMREAAVFYTQHLREERYTELLAEEALIRKQMEQNPNDESLRIKLADAQAVLRVLADQVVLGKKIGNELTVENLPALNGKTRAEVLLASLIEHSEDGESLLLEDLALPGIAARADFTTTGSFLDTFITDDPVLRTNVQRIDPLTTSEPEGRVYPAWNDWEGNFNRLFRLPIGLDEGHSTLMANHAANNVWQGVRPRVSLGTDMSYGEASNKITEGAVQYVNQHISSERFTQNENISSILYGGRIPVFGSVHYKEQEDLIRSIATPNVPDRAFALQNVKAVIVSGHRIEENGHHVVVLTFVYGEPGSMYFLQNAVATSATSNSRGYTSGSPMAFDEKTFRATTLGGKFSERIEAQMNQIILREREENRLRQIELERQRREAALVAAQELAEREDVAVQRENLATMTSAARSNRLIKIADHWNEEAYRMLLTDEQTNTSALATFKGYTDNPGPAFTAGPQDGRNEPDTKYTVVIEGPGGRTLSVDLDAYNDRTTPPLDRRLMQEFITAPIQGQARDSLFKVADLFPYDNFISSWRTNHYYKAELVNELLPLYNDTPDYDKAQGFLNELFQQLRNEGAITAASKEKIVTWFREHKRMFGIQS